MKIVRAVLTRNPVNENIDFNIFLTDTSILVWIHQFDVDFAYINRIKN
jgi:hypothetical protein